jgi:hypothetical protein
MVRVAVQYLHADKDLFYAVSIADTQSKEVA